MKRYVYVIPATAPDGVVHRYIGQTAQPKTRMSWHQRRHEKGKHKNIPAHFTVDWDAVLMMGPLTGTVEEIAHGEEQRLYEYWQARGPVLNRVEPRRTTAEGFIAACGVGGRRNIWKARAALTAEGLAAGRKKSGQISGGRNRDTGRMAELGRRYGAVYGPQNIRKAQAALAALPKDERSAISRRNGSAAGRKSVECGRLQSYNLMRTPEERAALAGKAGKMRAKYTNAKRWGVEVQPGLWVSRKTGAVLLDVRASA